MIFTMMNVPTLLLFIIQFSPICTMSPGLYKSYFDIAPLSVFIENLGKEKCDCLQLTVNHLAGGDQGGAPHVTVISQRRGLAWELVRRMSAHQVFSFRHVDMDSVDTGSGDTGTRDTFCSCSYIHEHSIK